MGFDGIHDVAIANQNNGVEQSKSNFFDQCWNIVKENPVVSSMVAAGAVVGIAALTRKLAFAEKAAAVTEDAFGCLGRELGATARASETAGLAGKAGGTALRDLSELGGSPLATRISWGPEISGAEATRAAKVIADLTASDGKIGTMLNAGTDKMRLGVIELGGPLSKADLAQAGLKLPEVKLIQIHSPSMPSSIQLGGPLSEADLARAGVKVPQVQIAQIHGPSALELEGASDHIFGLSSARGELASKAARSPVLDELTEILQGRGKIAWGPPAA